MHSRHCCLQVNYINAHATSTPAGDVAELQAIKAVFADMSHIKLNATKSLVGHTLGASGGLEGIATIQAIRTGRLHPTLNQVRICVCCVWGAYECVYVRAQVHDGMWGWPWWKNGAESGRGKEAVILGQLRYPWRC